MRTLEVYLHFDGNCREVLDFYRSVFSPDCPVMNAPNVKGIGPKITLYFRKWLNYAGSRETLAELEASQQPWDRVLSDLPVLPLGHARAKALARAFPSAQELAGEFLSDMYFMGLTYGSAEANPPTSPFWR